MMVVGRTGRRFRRRRRERREGGGDADAFAKRKNAIPRSILDAMVDNKELMAERKKKKATSLKTKEDIGKFSCKTRCRGIK